MVCPSTYPDRITHVAASTTSSNSPDLPTRVCPSRVDYQLTELGRSLLEPLRAVRRWAEKHVPEIQAANAAAAGREPG